MQACRCGAAQAKAQRGTLTAIHHYKTVAWLPHDVHEINDPILDSDSMDQRVFGSAGNLPSRFRILLFWMIDVRVFAFFRWNKRVAS
jgi:hypothetical protein